MHASAAGAKARPLNAGLAVDIIATESSPSAMWVTAQPVVKHEEFGHFRRRYRNSLVAIRA
jgi:hypothetical protein